MYLLTFIRGVVCMWFIFFTTLIFSITSIILSVVFKAPGLAWKINRWCWGWPNVILAGVRLEVRGEENLPPDGQGFLYLFNHTSYMDIIAMITGLPKIPSFGAKIELFSIPFFGPAMRAIGNLPIARDNRDEVLKLYKETEARAHKGECFALAPEGTRQKGGELGRFKKGPFIFALGAGIPVVPLVIVGAEQVQPKGSFLMNVGNKWSRTIVLQIQKPVDAKKYSQETITDFQNVVKAQMDKDYQAIQKELGLI